MNRLAFIAAVIALASSANGATLSVPSQHATIAAARTASVAGDVIQVNALTYTADERVIWTNKSGTVGNNIVVAGINGKPQMRGFEPGNVSNLVFMAFEITHDNTTDEHAFEFSGTVQRVSILNNYVHETHGKFVHCADNAITKYITIRNNTNYWLCHPGSWQEPDNAVQSFFVTADHWLVEYNTIQRAADYFVLFGNHHIMRNNVGFDTYQSYWITNGMHWDGFQPGSDSREAGTKDHVVERNIIADLRGTDGHFGIWQDTITTTDSNIVIRGNVAIRNGTGFVGAIGTDGMRIYQNTSFASPCDDEGGVVTIYQAASHNHWVGNNVMSHIPIIEGNTLANEPLIIDTGSTGTLTNNLGFQAARANGTQEESYVSTNDPSYYSTNNGVWDFRIQPGSPAINTGTTNMVWITSASGSGTSFTVNDGYFFTDGWGIVEGDAVTINGTTTRITAISVHTITVRDSVTWTQNDAVLWGRPNGRPDIGAYSDNAVFLTAATMSQAGPTYSVAPTGDARGVWFSVNGIPTHWIYEKTNGVFQVDVPSGTVTAEAYAEWAQLNPVVVATASGAGPYAPLSPIRAGTVGQSGKGRAL